MTLNKPTSNMIIGDEKTVSYNDIKKHVLIHCVLDLSNMKHTIMEHNFLVDKFKDSSYIFKDNCPFCEMGSQVEGLI